VGFSEHGVSDSCELHLFQFVLRQYIHHDHEVQLGAKVSSTTR
jgi:hypothetical protein